MKVYTLADARRNLSRLLEHASREGEVRIQSGDGRMYVLQPSPDDRSPLDVQGVPAGLNGEEIVEIVREGRERGPSSTSTD